MKSEDWKNKLDDVIPLIAEAIASGHVKRGEMLLIYRRYKMAITCFLIGATTFIIYLLLQTTILSELTKQTCHLKDHDEIACHSVYMMIVYYFILFLAGLYLVISSICLIENVYFYVNLFIYLVI